MEPGIENRQVSVYASGRNMVPTRRALVGSFILAAALSVQFALLQPKTYQARSQREIELQLSDRLTFRVLLGSPRLVAGDHQVRVTADPEAELKSRPWMASEPQSSDSAEPVWRVRVPAVPPYSATLERQPNTPVSGVVVDLLSSYQGEIRIDVSGQSYSFRPGEVLLGHPKDFANGFVRVERIPTVAAVASTDRDEDYPDLLTASDGSVWLTWIEFDGRSDTLRATRFFGSERQDFGALAGPGDLYRVDLEEHNGQVWIVWSEQRDDNWDLFSKTFSSGRWSDAERLTTNVYPDWNHRIRSDGSRLWMIWQAGRLSGDEANWEIFLRFFEKETWSRALNISDHPANDWQPSLAVRSGRAYVAWDSYRNGNYDLFLAESNGQTISAARALTASPNMEVRADLAHDAQGRLWYSWEEAGPDWGLDSVAFERGLHRERQVRVACLQGNQIYAPAVQPLDSPLPHLGPQSETARLSVDSQGRLWLFFRVNFLNRIWQQGAMVLTGDRWSEPIIFDASFGRQTAPLAVASTPGGDTWVSWVSDNRALTAPFNAIHNDINLGKLSLEGKAVAPVLRTLEGSSSEQAQGWERNWPDYLLRSGDGEYHLVWGELHRHTDIDHHGRPDGALEDAYRYASDVAALDFFASTDHIHGEPLESGVNVMTWWRSQKYADLHRLSGIFEPLYAYERAKQSPGGHKNLVFAQRGGPLFKGTERNNVPTDLWDALDRSRFPIVVIPHQLTGPAIDWSYHNPRYEPIMELYQGRRQNYEYDGAPQPPKVQQTWGKKEGSWAWDALARGLKLGFIASSDHGSTHMSYAAVYTKDLSRGSIVEALKARRTYAASDNIILDFRIESGGRQLLMGEAAAAHGQPKIVVKAIGTAPIKIIEVIRNNHFAYTTHPKSKEAQFTFIPTEAIAAKTYFYVRLIQEDGQMAWSSPIWLD